MKYPMICWIRQLLKWFFRNRETGAITIAQAPNLVLWIVIAGAPYNGLGIHRAAPALPWEIIFKGGLLVWAGDVVFSRGQCVAAMRELTGASSSLDGFDQKSFSAFSKANRVF
jgi:hypothetical protein